MSFEVHVGIGPVGRTGQGGAFPLWVGGKKGVWWGQAGEGLSEGVERERELPVREQGGEHLAGALRSVSTGEFLDFAEPLFLHLCNGLIYLSYSLGVRVK